MVLACFMLTACNEPKTYQYFMLHPKEIKAFLDHCYQTDDHPSTMSPECLAAAGADQTISRMFANATADGQAYGESIINDQIKLSQATPADAEYYKFRIQSKLAVLSLFTH